MHIFIYNKTKRPTKISFGSASSYYTASAFADYKATAEMPLPMIYQSGYLTIKGYDRETELFRLDFPNEEVRRGFLAMLASFSSRTGNIEDWTTEE